MAQGPDEVARARYAEMVERVFSMKVKGKANPYTSMNGNMFSFLDKAGTICLRLSKEDREAFVARFKTEPVVQYGAVMREYVQIPDDLVRQLDVLDSYLRKCLDYAKSLPAKATRR